MIYFISSLKQPYIGIVEGKHFDEPFLLQEARSRMKIMLLNSDEDLPLERIENIIRKALDLYKTALIKAEIIPNADLTK